MSSLFLSSAFGFVRRRERVGGKGGEITWVRKPDIALGVYEEIVDCVEIPAKVVVQKRGCLVGVRIQCSDASSLLRTSDRIVTSRSTYTRM